MQSSYDGRRRQLELQSDEIAKLRAAVAASNDRVKEVEAEKQRMREEQDDVHSLILKLESDLRRVQTEAERFGIDLKQLRLEKEQDEARHLTELETHERTCKRYDM